MNDSDADQIDLVLGAELAALTEIDWPADESGDRIIAGVTAALSQLSATPAGAFPRSGAGARWSARSRWIMAGAAAIAVALAGATIQLASGSPGAARTGRGSAALRSGSGRQPSMALAAMTTVSPPGALRGIGTTSNGNPALTCVTRSVCYTEGAHWPAAYVLRTADGGASWAAGAAVPRPAHPRDGEWDVNIACSTPLRCVSAYYSGMLVTSDGFAHVRFQPIGNPTDYVTWATCPTRHECVAAAWLGRGQKLLYSRDDGRSWATAAAPAFGTDSVAQLRCDASGACVIALSGGDEQNGTVAALSSADGGRAWVMSGTYSVGTEQQYWVSCGDARDCVVGGNSGPVPLAWIHVGSGGAISIRLRPQPPVADGTGISCATASDCFMIAGDTIVVTYDGGRTWVSAPVSAAPGGGFSLVDVSCPVVAGCIGLAQDNGVDWTVISDLQHSR